MTHSLTFVNLPCWDVLSAGAELDVEFFSNSLKLLAKMAGVKPEKEQVQAMLDMFRLDKWTNLEFRDACLHLARTLRWFPKYSDFVTWREVNK